MKRMILPALALGFAMLFAKPASAGHLFDGLGHNGCCQSECPKPECPKPCHTLCLPKIEIKHCCPKPECPKPCDPCKTSCLHDMCGKLKGMLHHDKCCDPCNESAPAAAEAAPAKSAFNSTPGPRLTPIPSDATTSTRTTRRSTDF